MFAPAGQGAEKGVAVPGTRQFRNAQFMDHTALIYLMDRDGHFVSPFNLKRTPEEAATDLKRYL